jgi:hypothetical protein
MAMSGTRGFGAGVALLLSLACQGCLSSAAPTAGAGVPPAANWDAEAARLIRTLDISAHLQDSARIYAAGRMAQGIPPKQALEAWILDQRDRGAVIRCKAEVSATDECVART